MLGSIAGVSLPVENRPVYSRGTYYQLPQSPVNVFSRQICQLGRSLVAAQAQQPSDFADDRPKGPRRAVWSRRADGL